MTLPPTIDSALKHSAMILLCDHPVVVPPSVCRRKRFPWKARAASAKPYSPGNQSQVAGLLFSARKAADVAEGQHKGKGGNRATPGWIPAGAAGGWFSAVFLQGAIQPGNLPIRELHELQKIRPPRRCPARPGAKRTAASVLPGSTVAPSSDLPDSSPCAGVRFFT
jgi:hypothetical protein